MFSAQKGGFLRQVARGGVRCYVVASSGGGCFEDIESEAETLEGAAECISMLSLTWEEKKTYAVDNGCGGGLSGWQILLRSR